MAKEKIINNSENTGFVHRKPGRKPAAVNQADKLDSNQDNGSKEQRKGRGRPKGSTDKTERKKRTDNDFQTAKPGQNTRTTNYALTMANLPLIDVNNPSQVESRINEYFNICASFDLKPSVAGLAIAFDADRTTLFNWLNRKTGTIQNMESFNLLKKAYKTINAMYETYLNDGSINPVSAFFIMKNNFGYRDTTDYIVTANQEQQISLPDIVQRSGLLSE